MTRGRNIATVFDHGPPRRYSMNFTLPSSRTRSYTAYSSSADLKWGLIDTEMYLPPAVSFVLCGTCGVGCGPRPVSTVVTISSTKPGSFKPTIFIIKSVGNFIVSAKTFLFSLLESSIATSWAVAAGVFDKRLCSCCCCLDSLSIEGSIVAPFFEIEFFGDDANPMNPGLLLIQARPVLSVIACAATLRRDELRMGDLKLDENIK